MYFLELRGKIFFRRYYAFFIHAHLNHTHMDHAHLNLQFFKALLDLCQYYLLLILNALPHLLHQISDGIANLDKVPLSEDQSFHIGGFI